jgi:hypothetical protein
MGGYTLGIEFQIVARPGPEIPSVAEEVVDLI